MLEYSGISNKIFTQTQEAQQGLLHDFAFTWLEQCTSAGGTLTEATVWPDAFSKVMLHSSTPEIERFSDLVRRADGHDESFLRMLVSLQPGRTLLGRVMVMFMQTAIHDAPVVMCVPKDCIKSETRAGPQIAEPGPVSEHDVVLDVDPYVLWYLITKSLSLDEGCFPWGQESTLKQLCCAEDHPPDCWDWIFTPARCCEGSSDASDGVPVAFATASVFRRLVGFEELGLQVLVAGMGGCGTTSLQDNLAAHPEVDYPRYAANSMDTMEDPFFGLWMGRRVLPTAGLMRLWHSGFAGRGVRLVKNPMLVNMPWIWPKLKAIPGLRFVFVHCDPTDFALRSIARQQALNDSTSVGEALFEATCRQPQHATLNGFFQAMQVRPASIGRDIFIAALSAFKADPVREYQALARFLNVGSSYFAASEIVVSHRLMSHAPPSSKRKLCESLSWPSFVLDCLATAYDGLETWLEEWGCEVPEDLRHRQSVICGPVASLIPAPE